MFNTIFRSFHWKFIYWIYSRMIFYNKKSYFILFCKDWREKLASVSCHLGVCFYCFLCIIDNVFSTFTLVSRTHMSSNNVNQKVIKWCKGLWWIFLTILTIRTLCVKKLGWLLIFRNWIVVIEKVYFRTQSFNLIFVYYDILYYTNV